MAAGGLFCVGAVVADDDTDVGGGTVALPPGRDDEPAEESGGSAGSADDDPEQQQFPMSSARGTTATRGASRAGDDADAQAQQTGVGEMSGWATGCAGEPFSEGWKGWPSKGRLGGNGGKLTAACSAFGGLLFAQHRKTTEASVCRDHAHNTALFVFKTNKPTPDQLDLTEAARTVHCQCQCQCQCCLVLES